MTFKSSSTPSKGSVKLTKAASFHAITSAKPFKSHIPPEPRFAVQNLFAFKRGRADLVLSLILLAVTVLLFLFFFTETGWHERAFTSRSGRALRLGKILKQPWVGPAACLCLMLPAAFLNLWASYKSTQKQDRKSRPNQTLWEVTQWARALEFISYFILYTWLVPVVGYLIATVLMACYLTYRLGYKGWRWQGIAALSAFVMVLIFRTGLQIKTPVNIWLYNQLPQSAEIFMKVYF